MAYPRKKISTPKFHKVQYPDVQHDQYKIYKIPIVVLMYKRKTLTCS